MRAVVYEKYGPPEVLQLKELEKPAPRDQEVLIKVRATTVTAGDWRARSLIMPGGFGPFGRLVFGIRKPRQPILGCELAGDIEAIGKDVRRFKVGDPVFAFTAVAMGCHAEYKCMAEDGRLALKPPGLSYEEAAAISSGGTTALHFFRKANLQSGEKVLVNGASGGVGTAAVQLARAFGADVAAVCSGGNAALVSSLGAAKVLDYTKEDFTKSGETYDVIVDTAGTAPFSRIKDSLKKGGRLLRVLSGLGDLFQGPWMSLTSGKKMFAGPASSRAEDLRTLAELAQTGKFKPVIDRRYPFEQLVEAHRYVDSGRKKGNVVITMGAMG
jgi:NADPH:quinone reductase-like Zn-dependent oxidoreductase